MGEETLIERLGDWPVDVTVDREQRLVRNVALAGRTSRNGYDYLPEALRNALELYRDKPVFLDHSVNRGRAAERSTRDLVGSIVEARLNGDRIRGDVRVLETAAGDTFLQLVAGQAPGVGMSHVVLAERSADGRSVERIVDVYSVDVVVGPATTTTFQESTQGGDSILMAQEIAAAAGIGDGSVVESFGGDWPAERRALLAELALVRRDLEIARVLETSGLPAGAVTECFREQLRSAEDATARARLIADRRLLAGSRRERLTAVSAARQELSIGYDVDAEFIRVLRHR